MKLYVIEWFESGEWWPATNDVYVDEQNAVERCDILRKLEPGRRYDVAEYERASRGGKRCT